MCIIRLSGTSRPVPTGTSGSLCFAGDSSGDSAWTITVQTPSSAGKHKLAKIFNMLRRTRIIDRNCCWISASKFYNLSSGLYHAIPLRGRRARARTTHVLRTTRNHTPLERSPGTGRSLLGDFYVGGVPGTQNSMGPLGAPAPSSAWGSIESRWIRWSGGAWAPPPVPGRALQCLGTPPWAPPPVPGSCQCPSGMSCFVIHGSVLSLLQYHGA
jgi:hypothetical protein